MVGSTGPAGVGHLGTSRRDYEVPIEPPGSGAWTVTSPSPRSARAARSCIRRAGQDRERAVVERHDVLHAEELDRQRRLVAGPS